MSAETCTRCKEPISDRTPSEGVTQRIMLNRTVIRWRLHFERFRWVWLPKHADERVTGSWTELILCDWCAGDVFLLAQGLQPRTDEMRKTAQQRTVPTTPEQP